jgi:two-component system, cell cycle sensor histidine kinase and response regulator CckA
VVHTVSVPDDVSRQKSIRVLLLEDNPADAELSLRQLRRDGFQVDADIVRSPDEFKERITSRTYDIVLGDYRLPGWTGMEAFQWLRAEGHDLPFILVSGTLGDDFAVECIKLGVTDYVLKDRLERLTVAVRRALEEEQLRRQHRKNITERLQNEERLRQSEERFSKAFRSSPLPITISTRAEGRYVDANEAFLRMMGRPREELVGRTANELNVWNFPEDRNKMVEALDRDGRVSALETVFNSRTNGERRVQVSAELIQLNGIPCVLAITNDVTEAKRMEAQFRQAQKMEAVGRLAGGMAHDFNNMLGVIIGYCDLLRGRSRPEDAVRDASQIKKAAQRAAALTRQLLAFSRQQVLLPRVLNLNDVVKDISQMLLRVIAEDISLAFVPAPSLGSVKADLGQIEQVLMNLVVNARDAMPRGGKIVIETANVELDETYSQIHQEVRPGPYVLLSVSDTGSGMDSKTISKVFEPFFTTKGPGEGTGLGLSMVYGVIRQSGGYIWVYSEPGQGATFKIYLPRIEEPAEPLPRTTPEIIFAKGSETVLLVEDEQNLCEVTVELLESEGYRVLVAKDGPSAIAISQGHRDMIHVLLTDIVLPNMSGTALAGRIKEFRPDLKVLYMSGYTGNLVAHQGILDSGDAFIQKPFTKHSLLSELRAILDR